MTKDICVYLVTTCEGGKLKYWKMRNRRSYVYLTLKGAVECAQQYKKVYPDKYFTVKKFTLTETGSYWKM